MPVYERQCERCAWGTKFSLERYIDREMLCPECGGWTVRIWTSAPTMIPDTYATPVVDDMLTKGTVVHTSRSEHRRAMAVHGVRERVRHVDGDKHTSRWV